MPTLHTPSEAVQWLRRHAVSGLHTDSRQIQAGDAFIAWPGAAMDARQHVPSAIEHGAVACLVDADGLDEALQHNELVASLPGLQSCAGEIAAEFLQHPSNGLDVIAVTGTNGKTSTVWWLAQALSSLPAPLAIPCAMIGTLGVGCWSVNEGAALQATGLTTPDPVVLQSALANFVQDGMKACAIEASSIGIEEQRLAGTRIRVALFTNFTQDHLDYHGNMQAYACAKRKLFAWPDLSCAVINVDDALGRELAHSLADSELDIWTVSCTSAARLRAHSIQTLDAGVSFVVQEAGEAHCIATQMIGDYNVVNLLGVIAAMRALGVPLLDALAVCSRLQSVPGRMECLGGTGNSPLVLVDYAHTPDALQNALTSLQPIARQRQGRLVCVFGCGGDRDASKRPLMGSIATQLADFVVVTSDNPRSENPQDIAAHIVGEQPRGNALDVQLDRATAIRQAVQRADAADVILVAGKGHELTQEISGVKYAFSDRDHVSNALKSRPTVETVAAAVTGDHK